MRKSKFTEDQIAFALKQAELGISVEEARRKMGISDATSYVWRKKYGGVGPSELRRLRQLEEENRKLKQIVANLSLRVTPSRRDGAEDAHQGDHRHARALRIPSGARHAAPRRTSRQHQAGVAAVP